MSRMDRARFMAAHFRIFRRGAGDDARRFHLVMRVGDTDVTDEQAFVPHGDVQMLPPALWSVERRTMQAQGVRVAFELSEVGGTERSRASIWLWAPYFLRDYTLETERFTVQLRVRPFAAGRYPEDGDAVYACRAGRGDAACVTVAGEFSRVRVEIHPVVPTPREGLPPRPAWTAGTESFDNPAVDGVIGGPQPNALCNPAVVPILTETEATPATAARIACSAYWPATMGFRSDDPRLTWRVEPSDIAAFVGEPRGLDVMVRGLREGVAHFFVRIGEEDVAEYRALVGSLIRIPFRITLLRFRDPNSARVSTNATQAARHVAAANQILRQTAIELVPDSVGAPPADEFTLMPVTQLAPGIFEVPESSVRRVERVRTDEGIEATNARERVLNFVYVHSMADANILGWAIGLGAHPLGTETTDDGSPSTSWRRPSGVAPDRAAQPVRSLIHSGRTASGYYTSLICEWNRFHSEPDRWVYRHPDHPEEYAQTIAHEAAHLLGLKHRGRHIDQNDEVRHPHGGNLMDFHPVPFEPRTDIDILQARIMRASTPASLWPRLRAPDNPYGEDAGDPPEPA